MQESESSCVRATVASKTVELVQGLCTQEEGVQSDQDMDGKGCDTPLAVDAEAAETYPR